MKLILSSNDFSNPKTASFIRKHLGMPLSECHLLYLPNENVSEKQMRGTRFQEKCEGYGFSAQNVTVCNYYHPELWENRRYDALYMGGGNTFSTLYRIRHHGVEETLKQMILGGAVYIGGSCGAHIVSSDISHVAPFDENRTPMTDFRGMNLFDGILFCHFCEERVPYYEKALQEGIYPVYALPNGSSIMIQDGVLVRDE